MINSTQLNSAILMDSFLILIYRTYRRSSFSRALFLLKRSSPYTPTGFMRRILLAQKATESNGAHKAESEALTPFEGSDIKRCRFRGRFNPRLSAGSPPLAAWGPSAMEYGRTARNAPSRLRRALGPRVQRGSENPRKKNRGGNGPSAHLADYLYFSGNVSGRSIISRERSTSRSGQKK